MAAVLAEMPRSWADMIEECLVVGQSGRESSSTCNSQQALQNGPQGGATL